MHRKLQNRSNNNNNKNSIEKPHNPFPQLPLRVKPYMTGAQNGHANCRLDHGFDSEYVSFCTCATVCVWWGGQFPAVSAQVPIHVTTTTQAGSLT